MSGTVTEDHQANLNDALRIERPRFSQASQNLKMAILGEQQLLGKQLSLQEHKIASEEDMIFNKSERNNSLNHDHKIPTVFNKQSIEAPSQQQITSNILK